MKKICILGATGSIGEQTLEVIRGQKDDFKLISFSSHKNYEKTIRIIKEFNPKYVAITDHDNFKKVIEYCKENSLEIELLEGVNGLTTISTLDEIEIVVTAVVGMIGLVPTLEAIKAGKDIALANKETLVTGGELVINAAEKYGIKILPVDSEHGAIFQCIQGNEMSNINKILLTASGGPFRGKNKSHLLQVTPKEAISHPKWNMGKKISVDSSTLVNKGLEVIEAHWLFNIEYKNIEVVIHPESIIHSMVEYKDGSVLAQLSNPDMKLPIQYALNYPKRGNLIINQLDLFKVSKLTFEKPDLKTFEGLKLAYDAGISGGIMPTVYNVANEVSVNLFLNNKIKYLEIVDIIKDCLSAFKNEPITSVETILEAETNVKKYIEAKRNLREV
ncbi:1-deoxy-D-xylulose 5-phosphate reductoisomerase [Clostridium homopropionicum DSM 5847]|uniref:1-deoxy-D-xylulose 5-phosphate reductoisomerase n=1 Tax=Clostridium homopropionicum DSM 5847 TaxID=1121318 RepID=A0A0L6ZD14_9CLOT|nr:1-deoxy-D-xylulose-5-phosphate reductoisomerase [Clostridium homopropionicum]KOA20869.1 1-deoxy-D-xylulose 5-phosphate reductoisomerase [Clostridium homopropionicum DSM 5847]SFG03240.1 1-deoxy-D-xylulose 5-phosphate reductoisomerase [Clostridium homopropionicum]